MPLYSKVRRSAGSIGLIKKALFNEVTPIFAQVRGNFIINNNKYKPERSILLSHLNDHIRLKTILITQLHLIDKLKHLTGRFLIPLIPLY